MNISNLIQVNDILCDELGLPIANYGNIKELRIGLRPYTKDVLPKIYTEIKNNKVISHNYGHGAAGWTLLFGCVKKSINSFEDFIKTKLNNKDSFQCIKEKKTIIIIGLGAMGLTTALYLISLGYKNIKLIGYEKDYITSHIAGGSFRLPAVVNPKSAEDKQILYSYMLDTFLTYKNINEGNHILSHILKDTTKDIIMITDDENTGAEYFSEIRVTNNNKKIKVKYGDNKSNKYIELFACETMLIHTDEYLRKAFKYIKNLSMDSNSLVKVAIKQVKLNSFDDEDVDSSYIFNCSGFGSVELNNDKEMYPGCGHGYILKNQQKENDFNFVLTIKSVPGLENTDYNGTLYFMPKEGDKYFLGGTNIVNYYGDDHHLNRKEWIKVIKRARYFFHGIDIKKELPKIKSSLNKAKF